MLNVKQAVKKLDDFERRLFITKLLNVSMYWWILFITLVIGIIAVETLYRP